MVEASWQYLYPAFPVASPASVLCEEAPFSHAFCHHGVFAEGHGTKKLQIHISESLS